MWLGITASCSKLHAYAPSRQTHFQAAMQPFICLQDQRTLSTQETPLLQKHNQLKRPKGSRLVCKAGRNEAWLLSCSCSAGSSRDCGTEARLADLRASLSEELWHQWPRQQVRVREVGPGLCKSSLTDSARHVPDHSTCHWAEACLLAAHML